MLSVVLNDLGEQKISEWRTMKNYKLSFCIPEYNNPDAAYKLVTQLLTNKDDRFQVVVMDDASTDDTFERLQTIKDGRLKLCRNQTNLGAKPTWCRALEHGDGEWLYLVMGRDRLNADNIGKLIDMLDDCLKKNVGCAADRKTTGRMRIFSLYDSVKYFLTFGEHPTGAIFRRTAFHSIRNRRRYFQLAFAYPEIYIKRDILCSGYTGAVVNANVYTGEVNIDKAKVVSCFEKNKNVLYWYPQRHTEQFLHVLKMTEYDQRFDFSQPEYDALFLNSWKNLMNKVSYNWRKHNADKVWTAHYGKECRTVGKQEMLCNILSAYKTINRFYREQDWNMSFQRHAQMLYSMIKTAVQIIVNKSI